MKQQNYDYCFFFFFYAEICCLCSLLFYSKFYRSAKHNLINRPHDRKELRSLELNADSWNIMHEEFAVSFTPYGKNLFFQIGYLLKDIFYQLL